MAESSTLEFLALHELFPAPPLIDLQKKWTEAALRAFLEGYLAFRRNEARQFQSLISGPNAPKTLFLDPLDCGPISSFTQHLFITESRNSNRGIGHISVSRCRMAEGSHHFGAEATIFPLEGGKTWSRSR